MAADPANPSPKPARGAGSRDVAKAVGLIGGMVLLSRVLGFVRQAIIAAKFGQGAVTSAYLYAFTLPDTLWNLVAGGAFFAAFVPVITEYFTNGDEENAWKTYSIITTLLFICLCVVIPIAWIFARPIFHYCLAPKFTDYAVVDGKVIHPLSMTVQMTRIVLPCQFFFFLGTLMQGMLQSKKQFLWPAIAPVIYNLGIIIVGVALSPMIGIKAFSWGAFVGALVGNFLLQISATRRLGGRYEWSLDLRHPGVRKAGRLVLPVIFGVSLPQATSIVNGIFVSKVDSAKAILDFSNQLMQLPLGIFGQAIGIAVLPTLSQQATQRDRPAFRRTLSYGIRLALFLTVPVSVLMIVLAEPLITIVYQRGHFTHQDTMHAVPSLQFFALGVGAWSAQSVVARAFYARKDTWTPVIAGMTATIIFVFLNIALTRLMDEPGTPLLTRGPALATTIAAIYNALLLMYFAHFRFGGIYARKIVRSLYRMIIACVPMGIVAWTVHHFLHARSDTLHSSLAALAQLALAGGLGLAAFVGTAIFVRCPEIKDVLSAAGSAITKVRGRLGL